MILLPLAALAITAALAQQEYGTTVVGFTPPLRLTIPVAGTGLLNIYLVHVLLST
jgi:hypothetical protein